jgi:hypothetical protein
MYEFGLRTEKFGLCLRKEWVKEVGNQTTDYDILVSLSKREIPIKSLTAIF